jgi:hypothetical protein
MLFVLEWWDTRISDSQSNDCTDQRLLWNLVCGYVIQRYVNHFFNLPFGLIGSGGVMCSVLIS